jgi:hypothetical protein
MPRVRLVTRLAERKSGLSRLRRNLPASRAVSAQTLFKLVVPYRVPLRSILLDRIGLGQPRNAGVLRASRIVLTVRAKDLLVVPQPNSGSTRVGHRGGGSARARNRFLFSGRNRWKARITETAGAYAGRQYRATLRA